MAENILPWKHEKPEHIIRLLFFDGKSIGRCCGGCKNKFGRLFEMRKCMTPMAVIRWFLFKAEIIRQICRQWMNLGINLMTTNNVRNDYRCDEEHFSKARKRIYHQNCYYVSARTITMLAEWHEHTHTSSQDITIHYSKQLENILPKSKRHCVPCN